MLPEDLKGEVTRQARDRGISLGEFIREALVETVARIEKSRASGQVEDPLYADTDTFPGESATDLARHHDDYLYRDGH